MKNILRKRPRTVANRPTSGGWGNKKCFFPGRPRAAGEIRSVFSGGDSGRPGANRLNIYKLTLGLTQCHRGHSPSWSSCVHSPSGSSCVHSPSRSSCVHSPSWSHAIVVAVRSLAIKVVVRSLAIRVAVVHSPSGSSCVHWCLKRISFVSVPTAFSVSHLPRWCRRTFAKHSATVLKSVWTWLSSTEVSNVVIQSREKWLSHRVGQHSGGDRRQDSCTLWKNTPRRPKHELDTFLGLLTDSRNTRGWLLQTAPRLEHNKVVMLCILCN